MDAKTPPALAPMSFSSSSSASRGSPLDFSFQSLSNLSDLENAKPRKVAGHKTPRRDATSGKYHCVSLKLCHNSFSSLQGLWEGLTSVVFRPELVGWLDLSFNGLESLDEGEVSRLNSLKLLYLHGNRLRRLQALQTLGRLPLLLALTLHGNPVSQQKGYRAAVLALLPQVSALDFAKATDSDRQDAALWARRNLPLPP